MACRRLHGLLKKSEHNPRNVLLGGSPRIHAGDGALQRSSKSSVLITRFSAGDQKPGAKAHLKIATLFRWTKVQLPLLKQGAPTKAFPIVFPQLVQAPAATPSGWSGIAPLEDSSLAVPVGCEICALGC